MHWVQDDIWLLDLCNRYMMSENQVNRLERLAACAMHFIFYYRCRPRIMKSDILILILYACIQQFFVRSARIALYPTHFQRLYQSNCISLRLPFGPMFFSPLNCHNRIRIRVRTTFHFWHFV